MRAVRVDQFGGPEVLRLVEVEDPRAAAGEVVVRLHAAGVNPVEAYIRTGQYARLPELPYTPGGDGAGVVEALGEGVSGMAVGDRVYVAAFLGKTGTYAERIACVARFVHPLPDGVSFGQGAALGVPAATAYRALVLRAQVKAGETVLVHGASGAVGIAAVQLARGLGLRVFGTAGSDAGAAAAKGAGAHDMFDHSQDGYATRITETAGARGVNVVLEMLANINLDRDLTLLAPRGRIVVIGSRGRIEIDPRQTMGKETAILGTTLWSTTPEEYTQIHAALVAALESGVLRPVVGRELPLEQAADAHRAILTDRAVGKIVLTM
ncbi:MAG: NADPH:quinone reductase [Vicinamibacteria bacterium]|nr:NADPH:quinone reductase [Vicinamibacteria bacterium]